MRWLLPSSGHATAYRIVDALLDVGGRASLRLEGDRRAPAAHAAAAGARARALPLIDGRAHRALVDLRARGFDLAVVDVSPLSFVSRPRGDLGDLAWRMWRLQREQLGSRYRAMGVPVVEWRGDRPVDEVLAQIREVRRYARTVRI